MCIYVCVCMYVCVYIYIYIYIKVDLFFAERDVVETSFYVELYN